MPRKENMFPYFIVLGLLLVVLTGWWLFCRLVTDVPWWFLDNQVQFPLGRGEPVTGRHIILFGIIELWRVPENFVWVVRRSRSDPTPPDYRGYSARGDGWHWVWFPELLRITVSFINLRPQQLDFRVMRVNTTTNPVFVDSQVTVKVWHPILAAITLQESLVEVVGGLLSTALNYVAQGHSDMELMQLGQDKIRRLANHATVLINREEPDFPAIKVLEGYGLYAVVRFQSITLLQEVQDALAGLTAAELDQRAAKHQAGSVLELRRASGIPDGNPWGVAAMLAQMFLGRFGPERQITGPSADVKFSLGSLGGSASKEGRKGKRSTKREEEDDAEEEETEGRQPDKPEEKKGEPGDKREKK